jgi:hypothetical protein
MTNLMAVVYMHGGHPYLLSIIYMHESRFDLAKQTEILFVFLRSSDNSRTRYKLSYVHKFLK